jgi:tRNA threonylcarbamoyladenosine biosynthesis protein TsaE
VKKIVRTLKELKDVSSELLASCTEKQAAHLFALSGELGTGKTALVKQIGTALGIREEITSPTFVIMKSYAIPSHPFFKTLTHVDAYRVESDDEMRVLGFKGLLKDSNRLICVEWPERIEKMLPKGALRITIGIADGGSREISYGS